MEGGQAQAFWRMNHIGERPLNRPVKPTRIVPAPERQPVADQSASAAASAKTEDTTAERYRPIGRRPMARLHIFDDDGQAEVIRLRDTPFVIGRTEGHVTIPQDDMMSSRHAEITLTQKQDRWVWVIQDLNSTNGVFVKCRQPRSLPDKSELLIGSGRYEFRTPVPAAQLPGTRRHAPGHSRPSLVAIDQEGRETVHRIPGDPATIGSDKLCDVVLDDPLVSARHLQVFCKEPNAWWMKDLNSRNGVLLRVTVINCVTSTTFQLGGQRFRLEVVTN
jgi:pSer/pThr/pTyr-binding forkhead associated (FHA) protein